MANPPLDVVAWAGDLLAGTGLPVNTENLVSVVAWHRAEGGHTNNAATWNPLNTSKTAPGAVSINSHGVKRYPSRAAGLAATIATLRLSYYGAVRSALARTAGAPVVAAAVGASPWGTSGTLMAQTIRRARDQVAAHGPVKTGATSAAGLSAGGPLAGPAPARLADIPAIDLDARLGRIIVNNRGLAADVVEFIRSARLSLSTDQASTLTLSIEDPDYRLLEAGIFRGVPHLDYGPLKFQLATLEANGGTAGRGGLVAGFHPRSVQYLKRQAGPLGLVNASPTEWLAGWARKASARFVGEPSSRQPIVGAKGRTPTEAAETVWSAAARYADELGFEVFEAAGVIYFGRPSWLATAVVAHVIDWRPATRNPMVLTAPVVRRSLNAPKGKAMELTLEVTPALAESQFLTSSAIFLQGLATFDTLYRITALEVDLADPAGVVSITAASPDDPVPNPPDPPSNVDDGPSSSSTSIAPGAGTAGWFHPLNGKGRWSANFGQDRGTHRHAGVDIGAPTGTPIYAARPGRVTRCQAAGAYGNVIYIAHAGGFETRYAHQSRFATRAGAEVRQGELIGYVGSTGRSTGPHLHFEVRVGGTARNPGDYIRR